MQWRGTRKTTVEGRGESGYENVAEIYYARKRLIANESYSELQASQLRDVLSTIDLWLHAHLTRHLRRTPLGTDGDSR
jgi:hypothetical protein